MIVPQEFKRLAERFYQGSDEDVSTPDEWVLQAVRGLNSRQKAVVKSFLDRVLSGSYSGADLQRIWNDTSADYDFRKDDHLRTFLTLIRDMIERDR